MSSGIYEFTQAKIKNSSGIIQFSFWTMLLWTKSYGRSPTCSTIIPLG